MNNKLELVQHKFIESISKLCDSFGLNKFVAQLYAVLYLNDGPLSLDEISERLKVSKGNVSINIRELANWGAVKSVWVKGSRKDYYEANLDLKNVILNKLKSAIQKRIGEISSMINESKEIIKSSGTRLTEEESRIAKIYEERFKKIEELKTLASSALGLADKLF
ncbi:MAG: helix-turn-helix domain-containing protein [Candidatus Omnitrophota bacterium]|nr:helix-turn-helix domain-containing protein [Candidatus Omnitrophota bacterium]